VGFQKGLAFLSNYSFWQSFKIIKSKILWKPE
jgi:hypothetical protein